LRTHTVGGGWADLETRETGTLQRIWGEDEDYSDEEEKGEEYDGKSCLIGFLIVDFHFSFFI
jgi:hypothetical protein